MTPWMPAREVPDRYAYLSFRDQSTSQSGTFLHKTKKLKWINDVGIPAIPNHPVILRGVIYVVAIAAITTLALYLSGQLTPALPQAICTWQVGAGLGTFGLLIIGGAIIIHRVRTKPQNGSFTGEGHFQPAYLTELNDPGRWETGLSRRPSCYIDNSATVTINEINYHPVYVKKLPVEHDMIAIEVFLSAPVHAAAAMVWNAARIVFEPLRILAMASYERATGVPEAERRYHYSSIPGEFVRSIWGVVRAPFYMAAMMMAAVYAGISPINGRKLGALIEQEWGDGKRLDQSIWIAACNLGDEKFWQDLKAKWQTGVTFCIPGCWRPIAYVNRTADGQMGEVITLPYSRGEHGPRNHYLFVR